MKLKAFLIIVIGSFIVVSLSRSLWSRYRRTERLEELQAEVSVLEKEQAELGQRREEVTSEGFLEEEARDKLQMVKPGEKLVILPENVLEKIVSGGKIASGNPDLRPNWRRWCGLFF